MALGVPADLVPARWTSCRALDATSRCCRPAGSPPDRRLRAVGATVGPAAAADGGLLPRRRRRLGRADGRRRTGRRSLELRRRQPRTATEGSRPSVSPSRGGPRRTTSTTQVRADLDAGSATASRLRRRRRAAPCSRPPGPRRCCARRLRRAPAAALRPVRGRDPGRRPLDGALAAVGAAEPRPARPARGCARAEQAYRDGHAPLAVVEGFVRQVIGWRDYVWHLYWHLGEDYRGRNELDATTADAGLVRRPRRDARRRGLPAGAPWRRPRARLGAPHPAADGAGQLRAAARLAAGARSPTGSTARSSTATTG